MKRLLTLCCFAAGLGAHSMRAEADAPRILRKQVEVQASADEVWKAWTTVEGLRFVSAQSRIELRVGGPYEWFLDGPADARGKRGGQGSEVLAYLPHEVLAFSWTMPPAVPTLRDRDVKTHVVLQFRPGPDGTVRVDFAQLGWERGEDWDAAYDYFDKAWDYVLERLRDSFAAPPPQP